MLPEVREIIPPSAEKDNLQSSAELDPGQPFTQTQKILLDQIAFLVSTAQSVPLDWKGTYLAAIIELSKAALAIDSLDIPKIPQQRERYQLQSSTLPQNSPPAPVPSLPETPPEFTAVASQTSIEQKPTVEKEAIAVPDNLVSIREIAEGCGVSYEILVTKVREARQRGEIVMYGAGKDCAYPREELEAIAQQIKKRGKRVKIHVEIPLVIPNEPLVSLKEVANNPNYLVSLDQLRYCIKGAVKGGLIIRTGEKWDARYPESQIRAIARQLPRITSTPNDAHEEDVKKNPQNPPMPTPGQPLT